MLWLGHFLHEGYLLEGYSPEVYLPIYFYAAMIH